MITLRMSADEIAKAMDRDMKLSINRNTQMGRKWELYRRKKGKDKKFFIIAESYIECSRQEYLHWFLNDPKFYQRKDVVGQTFAIVKDDSRTYYVRQNNPYDTEICAYSSHFFNRYAERKNHARLYPLIIGRYFQNNQIECCIYRSDDKKNSVFATREGISLCRSLSNGICLYRTFVSYDMLKSTQKEAYDVLKPYINKIEELYTTMLVKGVESDMCESISNMATKSLQDKCNDIYKQFYE